MDLEMPKALAERFTNPAQKARSVSEAWGKENLFCPNCSSARLESTRQGFKAVDYFCPGCSSAFQLKSKSSNFGNRVVDGQYDTFINALESDQSPNLFLLQYSRLDWTVLNLLLIPNFAIPPSAIEKRKPLGPTARRAGWIGCFILLGEIPVEARIPVVSNGCSASPSKVREAFGKVKPFRDLTFAQRGWTLDVLKVVHALSKRHFTNQDIYAFSNDLAKRHPQNKHVRDKIRQQLQFLRDKGFLAQTREGVWNVSSDFTRETVV